MNKLVIATLVAMSLTACSVIDSQETKTAKTVARQQTQLEIGQPAYTTDWSLERHLVNEGYRIRNQRVATYAVWRSDYGMIEGDCPSMGYHIPYDTSITNPLKTTDEDQKGFSSPSLAVVEQAEPTGIYLSKNSIASWVYCVGDSGSIEPVLVESKVTTYPGPVTVDYETNRVKRSGAATVRINMGDR